MTTKVEITIQAVVNCEKNDLDKTLNSIYNQLIYSDLNLDDIDLEVEDVDVLEK